MGRLSENFVGRLNEVPHEPAEPNDHGIFCRTERMHSPILVIRVILR